MFQSVLKATRWLLVCLLVFGRLGSSFGQSILREYWLGLPGDAVVDLTGSVDFPAAPTGRETPTIFEGPINWGDEYGSRFRGYVTAPTTGNYTFFIAGDNQCELWLGTSTNISTRRLIARVLTWTGSRVWQEPRDGNAAAQKSAAIPLVAGQKYYIEALHKEGGSNDCIAVGWQLPAGTYERPIPGTRLSPFILSTSSPSIVLQPADTTVFEGDEVRFTIQAEGMEPLIYQWQRDDADLPIEKSATLIISAAQLSDSGARFRCIVSNPKGTLATHEALLTVNREITPPSLAVIAPQPGAIVRTLSQVEITFSEPVSGVDASDLLINNAPATNVTGVAAGPYLFTFAPVTAGSATIRFATDHGIKDVSLNENPFAGGNWAVTVDPNLPTPKVRISEIAAANETGLLDEDGEAEDWIELENYGTTSVSLNGFGLSDDPNNPAQWVFPNVSIPAGQRLVVFASGKDRRSTTAGAKLHTNFGLSETGEFLGLFDAASPRNAISALDPYPEQRVNFSYGLDSSGAWKYFGTPTPGAANGVSTILGIMPPPHFSSERGFFSGAFDLYITTDVPDAQIRYTRDGGDSSGSAGILYTNPLRIAATTVLRASVWKTNYLPSSPKTQTYLQNISAANRSLPAISIVTATNNLFGPTGIIGINGGTYASGVWTAVAPTDYFNPIKHGIAWERPTSVEFFSPTVRGQFQADCGIRIQGSDYLRPRYTTTSKFSYRLYFRGDYGQGRLEYPWFDGGVAQYDQIVLRAGHNDDTNPFIKDELMRRLFINTGQVGVRGDFATLYVNGVYKGYYNFCERFDQHFLRAWHGGDADWDALEPGPTVLDGDAANFNAMLQFFRTHSMTNSANYVEASRRLDLTNFVDYLLVNIYGANGDWPGNNWRAGRERSANGIWRFYMWDAEFALGTYGKAVSWDEFANELTQTSEIPTLYNYLRQSPEFLLLFADRINKHYYNGGALTDTNILRHFTALKNQMSPIISGFDTFIQTTWIPQRRAYVTNFFAAYGVAGAPGAPVFKQQGGRVPAGYQLTMTSAATAGSVIYYTTNGVDPRIIFTGTVSADAKVYTAGQPITLRKNTLVKARVLTPSNTWTALTEALFEVSEFGAPIRFTEINYNPPGGDAYEFVELKNFSATRVDLSGMSFDGIDFRFPENSFVEPGAFVVLAPKSNPSAFAARYPNAPVTGYYDNSLSNGGERISFLDRIGNIVAWVDYKDAGGWPIEADGHGYTLELADRSIDPNSPAAWRKSASLYGSPGSYDEPATDTTVRLSEILPANGSPGWVELFNPTAGAVDLSNYCFGDTTSPRRYVFPAGSSIQSGSYLVVNYNLPLSGGTLFLNDANTNRLDAVVFGAQLTNYSLARVDGVWTLANPTPQSSNTAAPLAPSTSILLNEWLANPVSGADDWIELHNTNDLPAAPQGLTISVSNALSRLPTLTFIPPHGFLQLFASEKTQPDNLSLKLPAAGGQINLYDANGALLNTVNYAAQLEGVSEGRFPDASAAITKFRGSPSPGASNYVINVNSTLVINELMARNRHAVIDPFGGTADWIEIYNSGPGVALDGLSLSDNRDQPGQWTFPAGSTIGSQQYLVIWFDETHPAATNTPFNTGRALSAAGGGVYLFNATGQIIDQIEYGVQPPDLSIGRSAGPWYLLAQPTPGGPNAAIATLGGVTSARINEWSAQPAWVELFNPATQPIALSGMWFTDDLSLLGQKKFAFPPLSYLGAGQFARWTASSGNSTNPGELNFFPSPLGESMRLYSSTFTQVDSVSYGILGDLTLARIPNGSGAPVTIAPTPEEANYLPAIGLTIAKVSPAENRVTFRNPSGAPIDLAGWTLSDNPLTVRQTFASQLVPARSTLTVTAGFPLDTNFGGQVTLARVPNEQARLNYGPATNGQAYSAVWTSIGLQSVLTPRPTNGGVVINEVMYHPTDDLENSEYIELHNADSSAVTMSNWRINGGVQFNFAPNFTMQPGETIVLVHFDPQQNPTARAAFLAHYNAPANATLLGPLRGKLGNDTDTIRLESPLPANTQGYIPYVTLDSITYTSQIPWPVTAGGGGPALHRIQATDLGNEPWNWVAGNPTPGTADEVRPPLDRDADGIPDIWEIANGLNPYDASDAQLDFDGDGLSNYAEYQLHTDPQDPSNTVSLGISIAQDGPILGMLAYPGIGYRVEFRDDLNAGDWQFHSNIAALPDFRIEYVPLFTPGAAQRYFRVVITSTPQ